MQFLENVIMGLCTGRAGLWVSADFGAVESETRVGHRQGPLCTLYGKEMLQFACGLVEHLLPPRETRKLP